MTHEAEVLSLIYITESVAEAPKRVFSPATLFGGCYWTRVTRSRRLTALIIFINNVLIKSLLQVYIIELRLSCLRREKHEA